MIVTYCTSNKVVKDKQFLNRNYDNGENSITIFNHRALLFNPLETTLSYKYKINFEKLMKKLLTHTIRL